MFKRAIVFSSIVLLMVACDDSGNNANISTQNTAPTAKDVSIKGLGNVAVSSESAKLGDQLTGIYTYSDADKDTEGSSTFRWLRNGQAIEEATQKKYTLTMKDRGAELKFEVVPVAAMGETQGNPVQSQALAVLKDALEPDQWYLDNTGVAPATWGKYKDLTKGADVGTKDVWNAEITGKGIVVSVFDDGLDFNHPDLMGQELQGFSTSYQTGEAQGSSIPPSATGTSHGTSCAGIIAAQSDSKGVLGIAPQAQLIGYRILVDNVNDALGSPYINALEADVSQVSNHSYGPADDGKLYPQSTEEYDAILALATQANDKKGHVMLFAAGNGRAYVPENYDKLSDINPIYEEFDGVDTVPRNFGDYAGLDMSQQHPYVISVSGFNANDEDVSYAEAGPATLIAGATGDSGPGPIDSTGVTLDVADPEKKPSANIATTGRDKQAYSVEGTHREGGAAIPEGFDLSFNGTSAATPTVSGVVALLRSANTELTWRDVRWILAKTARKIQGGGNGETSSGVINQATGKAAVGEFAKPFWSESGNAEFGKFSHHFGYGAVNAKAAIALGTDASYTLLPEMKTCKLAAADNVATVAEENGCPTTIEFVQVKYTVKEGGDINDLTFSMNLSDVEGKTIELLAPSTCPDDECGIIADTSVRGGTVGFMGDTLKTGSVFSFDVLNNGTGTEINVDAVTVFGFDKS